MSIKPIVSFVALAAITSFSVVACTTSTDASSEDPTGEVQDQELRKSITACNVDADCVAVPRGGCCSNGHMEAVNKHHIQAYKNATKCTMHVMCPMYLVHDTRVAECDAAVKQCKMVAIEDIKCGGFVMNAHQCPAGYDCDTTGTNPDLPGTCEAASTCSGPIIDCAAPPMGCNYHGGGCVNGSWTCGHLACSSPQ